MSSLEVVSLPNGQFAENCYLVADTTTREAVIIDPGEEPAAFPRRARVPWLGPSAIWLTHAHIDHILGVGTGHAASGAPIYLHPLDRPLYDGLPQFGAWVGMQLEIPPAPTVRASRRDRLSRWADFEFTVRFTPGTRPGERQFFRGGCGLRW